MTTISRLMPDKRTYVVYVCLADTRQYGEPGPIISLDVLRKHAFPWDVVQESAWKAHLVIRKYFGFGMLDDKDPFPDDYQARITKIFGEKHSHSNYLRMVAVNSNEYVPDEAVTRWLQRVHERHASQETNHFFFRFRAERLELIETFESFATTLGAHNMFAPSLDRINNPYASCRSRWSNSSSNAFGHDTYEMVRKKPYGCSIIIIPTLDFFYSRDLNGYDTSYKDWSTYEGTRKLCRIQRNLEIFGKLRGMFIWCCPSCYRYGRGAAGASSFNEAPEELDLSTVYAPLITDIVNAKPPEHDPGYDRWLGNFDMMIKMLWNEKTGMFQRTPIRRPKKRPGGDRRGLFEPGAIT